MTFAVERLRPGDVCRNWTVLRAFVPDDYGQPRWWCRCTCGAERPIIQQHLLRGRSKGCHKCKKMPTDWKRPTRRALPVGRPPKVREKMVRCCADDPESTPSFRFACGALVWERNRVSHLAEIHGISVDDPADYFEIPRRDESQCVLDIDKERADVAE